MSLPVNGEIGLKQVADLFEDAPDHSLSEFYQQEPVVSDTLTANDVLNKWMHYGIGPTGFVPEADLSGWTAPDTKTLRSTSNVGHLDMWVSPAEPIPSGETKFEYRGYLEGRYDDYDLEVIFSSDGNDDDVLGVLVSGEFKPETGEFGRLVILRNMGGGVVDSNSLFRINYQDDTTNGSIDIFEAGVAEGLTYEILDSSDQNKQGWLGHGPVRLLVSRRQDLIHVWISNTDDVDWVLAKTIDLKDLQGLTGSSKTYDYVGGRTAYGFLSNSQAGGKVTMVRTPTHLPVKVEAGGDNLLATYGKVPTFDFSEIMSVVDDAEVFDPRLTNQIPNDATLTALTSIDRGFLFSADVGQEPDRVVSQTAIVGEVASQRWGYSMECKTWSGLTPGGIFPTQPDVNYVGHDSADPARSALSSGLIGQGQNANIRWIFASDIYPDRLYLGIEDVGASSLLGKYISVEIPGLGRLISNQVVTDQSVWFTVMGNAGLNVYQYLLDNPNTNIYIGQWDDSELSVGFNDYDRLIAAGASFSPADGESAVGFETDVGSIANVPESGMIVNSVMALRGATQDSVLVLLTGHDDPNVMGRTVSITIGTLPTKTVILSDQTTKGTENVLLVPLSIPGSFSYLESMRGSQIDIGLTVSPSSASSHIYRFDEYERQAVEQLTHSPIASVDDLATTYNDLIYAVVPEGYATPAGVEADVIDCEVAADAVAVDGNDLYVLEGMNLRLYRSQAPSVGTKTTSTLLGTLDGKDIPTTYDRAAMSVDDDMLHISLTSGEETVVISVGRVRSPSGSYVWFQPDNIVSVVTSTGEVGGGLFGTPTNAGYLSSDLRSVRYARWNSNKSLPIGLSDFYGYSTRFTFVGTLTQSEYDSYYGGEGGVNVEKFFRRKILGENASIYTPLPEGDYTFVNEAHIIGSPVFGVGDIIGHTIYSGTLPSGSTLTILNNGRCDPAGGNGGGQMISRWPIETMSLSGNPGGDVFNLAMSASIYRGEYSITGGGGAASGYYRRLNDDITFPGTAWAVVGGGGGAGLVGGRAGNNYDIQLKHDANVSPSGLNPTFKKMPNSGSQFSGGTYGNIAIPKNAIGILSGSGAGVRGQRGQVGRQVEVDWDGLETGGVRPTSGGAGGTVVRTNGHTVTYL